MSRFSYLFNYIFATAILVSSCQVNNFSQPSASASILASSLNSTPVAPTRRITFPPVTEPSGSIFATYRGRSIHHNPPEYYAPLFELSYDEAIWEISPSANSADPRLILREDQSCFLALRPGLGDLLAVGRHQTGKENWRVHLYPSNYLIYSRDIEYDSKRLDTVAFGASLPSEYRGSQPNECQTQVETILSTFRVAENLHPEIVSNIVTYQSERLYYNQRDNYKTHFAIDYDEALWEMIELGKLESPKLILRDKPTCSLTRREESGKFHNIGLIELGEQLWMLRLGGTNRLIYETSIAQNHDGPIEAINFVLQLPANYIEDVHSECQRLAETVLNTARIVKVQHFPAQNEARFVTYQGTNIYYQPQDPNAPRFELIFDEAIWQVFNSGPNAPRLFMRREPSCVLVLREGSREMLSLGTTQLAGETWRLWAPQPHILVYSLPFGNSAFIFGVRMPEDYEEGQPSKCQQQAEMVLDTFTIVSDSE